MFLDQFIKTCFIFFIHRVEQHHFLVHVLGKSFLRIKNIGNTTAHACREVSASVAKNNHRTTSHVFAAMISNAFHHSRCTGVTNTKSLSGPAPYKHSSGSSTVQSNVSNNNIPVRIVFDPLVRIDSNPGTGKTFAEIVIGIALEFESDTIGCKGTKTLPRGSVKLKMNSL